MLDGNVAQINDSISTANESQITPWKYLYLPQWCSHLSREAKNHYNHESFGKFDCRIHICCQSPCLQSFKSATCTCTLRWIITPGAWKNICRKKRNVLLQICKIIATMHVCATGHGIGTENWSWVIESSFNALHQNTNLLAWTLLTNNGHEPSLSL